ncbi:MAG: hypothetical protein ABSE86_03190 [Bryobacteraceae bacterium]
MFVVNATLFGIGKNTDYLVEPFHLHFGQGPYFRVAVLVRMQQQRKTFV